MPSLVRFALEINEYPTTVERWLDQFPDFRHAYENCKRIQERFVAEMAIRRRFDTTFSIFYLKNRFAWVDKQDIRLQADNLQLNLNVGRQDTQAIDNKGKPGRTSVTAGNDSVKALPTPHGSQSSAKVPADVDGPPLVYKGTPGKDKKSTKGVGALKSKGTPKGPKKVKKRRKLSDAQRAEKRRRYMRAYMKRKRLEAKKGKGKG